MAILIDTSLWIDFSRSRSPQYLKEFIAPYILHDEACLAEPIIYEVLRYATEDEARMLNRQFDFFPILPTPPNLWLRGAELGRLCRKQGITLGSLDLLIATVALHHRAQLVTFDEDFEPLVRFTPMNVLRLNRPKPTTT